MNNNDHQYKSLIKDVFKNKGLFKRVLYTVFILLIFRVAANILIPGVSLGNNSTQNGGSLLNVVSILGGGGLRHFSIVALGVSPYITATIITQLLSADVVPYFTRLNKSGERGRIRIDLINRFLTIGFAFLQGYAVIASLQHTGGLLVTSNIGIAYILFVITGGTIMSLYLGDRINVKGVGNGTSMIIFSGIVANIPWNFAAIWNNTVFYNQPTQLVIGLITYFFYMLLFLSIIVLTVFLYQSVRKIPIQNTGSGLSMDNKDTSYLPLRINSAGVIPVIFASALLTTPLTIAQLFPNYDPNNSIVAFLFSFNKPVGLTFYFLLIVLFTFFYSQVAVNPDQITENLQKNGSFIPGVSPGVATKAYIKRILNRLNLSGGIFLGMICALPYIITIIKGLPSALVIGGTGVIIMVGVSLDTIQQLKGRVIQEKVKGLVEGKATATEASWF